MSKDKGAEVEQLKTEIAEKERVLMSTWWKITVIDFEQHKIQIVCAGAHNLL